MLPSSRSPDVGESILFQTFVVVVIGGIGSFLGACWRPYREIISITSMFNPGYSYVMLFGRGFWCGTVAHDLFVVAGRE
jgi:branched-subunit amino acid ABC-type transport system permease component